MESVKEYIITRLVTYNTSPFLLYFPLLPTFGRINVQDLQFPCLWLKFPLCVLSTSENYYPEFKEF